MKKYIIGVGGSEVRMVESSSEPPLAEYEEQLGSVDPGEWPAFAPVENNPATLLLVAKLLRQMNE